MVKGFRITSCHRAFGSSSSYVVKQFYTPPVLHIALAYKKCKTKNVFMYCHNTQTKILKITEH